MSLTPALLLRAYHQQPDRGRVSGIAHHFRQSAVVLRLAYAHRHVKNLLTQFDHALHGTQPPSDDNARGQQVLVPRAAQLRLH